MSDDERTCSTCGHYKSCIWCRHEGWWNQPRSSQPPPSPQYDALPQLKNQCYDLAINEFRRYIDGRAGTWDSCGLREAIVKHYPIWGWTEAEAAVDEVWEPMDADAGAAGSRVKVEVGEAGVVQR